MTWPQRVETIKRRMNELGDETEEDAMAVQADDGDIIQDRRAGPYVLSSPHPDRRLDHCSIHVLSRVTDQDKVAAAGVDEHAKDELGDETVEHANAVLAGGDSSLARASTCPEQSSEGTLSP